MTAEKPYGINMMIYGVANTPLKREERWFASADQLDEFYQKNRKREKKSESKKWQEKKEKASSQKE